MLLNVRIGTFPYAGICHEAFAGPWVTIFGAWTDEGCQLMGLDLCSAAAARSAGYSESSSRPLRVGA